MRGATGGSRLFAIRSARQDVWPGDAPIVGVFLSPLAPGAPASVCARAAVAQHRTPEAGDRLRCELGITASQIGSMIRVESVNIGFNTFAVLPTFIALRFSNIQPRVNTDMAIRISLTNTPPEGVRWQVLERGKTIRSGTANTD